ncbi:hypothetical protein PHYSODRAFT_285001 [Phytophthora sojae]|uniref:Uncharacterized protein n=1 Tax=Phytophthora sojae (strain P6497) TaxID=1094619 RepID=G4YVB4_PHYSP|nr:hypothetical protein PHYSODRAFT_285001 [Phytophthora sojae]EGZ24921.1 hypothetical protein PHYSODRAFT_285001 [Phytophthora sojae]|eukprot:XP_009520209.1 hypothetical protein PHYSODRAFT_285001 [Phytophthora sojae]
MSATTCTSSSRPPFCAPSSTSPDSLRLLKDAAWTIFWQQSASRASSTPASGATVLLESLPDVLDKCDPHTSKRSLLALLVTTFQSQYAHAVLLS